MLISFRTACLIGISPTLRNPEQQRYNNRYLYHEEAFSIDTPNPLE